MNITQEITLDLRKQSIFRSVMAKQGDAGTRFVRISLTDDGNAYQPPEGAGVMVRCAKPDGTFVLNPGQIQADGTVIAELTDQILAAAGTVTADICLTNGAGDVLSSASFMILVEPAPMGLEIDSSNEVLALLEMIDKGQQMLESLSDAGEVLGERITLLEQEVADLKYQPIAFLSAGISPSVLQTGAVADRITVHWKLNKVPEKLVIAGQEIENLQEGSHIHTGQLTSDTTIALEAVDERDATARASRKLAFYPGVYYGVVDDGAPVDFADEILSWQLVVQAGRQLSFTVSAGANQRIGFALPTAYGTPEFYVGGFQGGFYKLTTLDFVNAHAHQESYDVWLSTNAGLGDTTVSVQ